MAQPIDHYAEFEPTSFELMSQALRHLEKEMHRVAPGIIRSRLTLISAEGVSGSASMFVDAIRACVHEELALFAASAHPTGDPR